MDIKKYFKGQKISDNTVTFNGEKVKINDIQGDIAHGTKGDKPFFIAKKGDIYAGGKSERCAAVALKKKVYESKTEEERINEFISKYAPDELHTTDEWIEAHQELSGSCYIGAYRFIKSKGIHRYEKYTTLEFLEIVDGAYGGDLIRKIKEKIKGGK